VILSVSRRTDIPNYYSEWFYNRIKEGFVYDRNLMNVHQVSKVALSADLVDCIVFWTKNPKLMMCGTLSEVDVVSERKVKSCKEVQLSLFE
jgi:ribosome-binding factor A